MPVTNRKMYYVLALVISRERVHELRRRTLRTALELNDKSEQGLPAASVGLVSPASQCTIAALCQASQEAEE